MTREQLEHVIRAVADLTGETKLIIIGSQAILGQFPDPPPELLVSQEIDVYTPGRPETAEFITGAFGLDTPFERTHRFQIDGVSPTTATVPGGWSNHLIPVCNANTNGATGWCLKVHDIAVATYFANREKDRRYATDLWHHGIPDEPTIRERIRNAPVTKAKRKAMLVAVAQGQTKSVVAVKSQVTARKGDVVFARLDDEVTLKRFIQLDRRRVELRPDSTNHEHQPFKVDLKKDAFEVASVAVGALIGDGFNRPRYESWTA